jgi:hypothetical protein
VRIGEWLARLLNSQQLYGGPDATPAEPVERNAQRLGQLIHVPTEYSKRRVETLTIESVNRLRWEITQEFVIPTLQDDTDADLLRVEPRAVSLGIYDKTRHPDLVATDASGSQLTVLDRQARGLLLGHAYLAKVLKSGGRFGLPIRLTEAEFDALLGVVAQVTALDERRADLARLFWVDELVNAGGSLARVNRNNEFSNDLETLAREIHLLALVRAHPGERVVVRHAFREATAGVSYWSDFAGTAPAFSRRVPTAAGRFVARWTWWIIFGTARAVLRLVGLAPFLIQLENRNAEHVESLHVVLQAPLGLTIEDAFWESLRDFHAGPTDSAAAVPVAAWERFRAFLGRVADRDDRKVASEFRRGRTTTLSAHADEIEVEDPKYWFGLQIAPSPLLPAGFVVVGVVSLVLAIAALVGEGHCVAAASSGASGCNPDSTALGVMLALPGLAAGVLSQARSEVTAKIGFGPRVLTLVAAVWPYCIAVLIGFRQMEPTDLAVWSRYGSAFAASVAVLLLMIGTLPRRPFCTKLGKEGGNGTRRKRWNRLRQAYAFVGLALSIAAGVGAFWAIGDLSR